MCSNEDDAHPCGLYKTVHVVEFFTCAQTLINIVNVSAYNTSTHVVPCLADVCVEKCTATCSATGFQYINTSTLMDITEAAANNRGLAMGCPGSQVVNSMYMTGYNMGDCDLGRVRYREALPPPTITTSKIISAR
jgi:hypothetical protein